MSGIRIHHPTKRNCALLIPHPGNGTRKPKTYRIVLDTEGDCIVSDTIWQRLQEARAAGWPHELIIANVVTTPPRQFVGGVSTPVPEHHIVRT